MSRLQYLGPLRDFPKRQYTWAGGEPADMGRRGEATVAALLAARRRGKFIRLGKGKPRRTLEEHIAHWLRELGLIETFRVEEIAEGSNLYRVRVRKTRKSPKVLITDIGFGVSQILPVLVICFYVPEGSIVLLEQPELHLHPAVQAGLADVLIDAVKRSKIQVILESHSEHLLKRFQRRISEQRLDQDQAAFYFCDRKDGESRLISLKLDDYGNITNWPKDFFGDTFGEMEAMTRAMIKRKKGASS